MTGSAISTRSAGVVPGRALAGLTAVAVALGFAFVLAPGPLAESGSDGFADQGKLRRALRDGFVAYWDSGDQGRPPALTRVIDYWFRYHVVKGAIASALLVVLVVLAVLLWKAFVRGAMPGAAQRIWLAMAGSLVGLFAFAALLAVIANIQGAVAPFSSLLPMLPSGSDDPQLSAVFDQIRQQLAGNGGTSAPVKDMVDDFARYHVAVAVMAAILMITAIGLSVVSWRKFTKSADARIRRVLGAAGIVSALMGSAAVVLLIANTTAVIHSTSALAAFFNGSW